MATDIFLWRFSRRRGCESRGQCSTAYPQTHPPLSRACRPGDLRRPLWPIPCQSTTVQRTLISDCPSRTSQIYKIISYFPTLPSKNFHKNFPPRTLIPNHQPCHQWPLAHHSPDSQTTAPSPENHVPLRFAHIAYNRHNLFLYHIIRSP